MRISVVGCHYGINELIQFIMKNENKRFTDVKIFVVKSQELL
jgi:hypothetical protein